MTAKAADKRRVVAATTEKRQRSLANLVPFKPGQSGNPAGRAKGSKHKLSEDFIAAMAKDFEENGETAITTCRSERPHEYLKIIAGMVPKELNVTTSRVEELSDDELADGIAALQSILAAQAAGNGSETPSRH